MDINVEKYVSDLKRFCKKHYCDDCPLHDLGGGCENINSIKIIYPILTKWIEEHPVKTYLMDIKDKFPDMIIDNDFAMKYCVWRFYGKNAKPKDGCTVGGCKKCWNREMT